MGKIKTREFTQETTDMQSYLRENEYINFSNTLVKKLVENLYKEKDSEIIKIKKAFEFVRDEIKHSWDIKSTRITIKASEVLALKEGICYAKSNLLAALLRAVNIPIGFCYQRLTLGDTPESGYCIHALNAIYLSEEKRWIRLDARGNKEGIDAQFSIKEEKLAFPVREKYDEKDYPIIYADPVKITMDTLKDNKDCIEMYMKGLPTEI